MYYLWDPTFLLLIPPMLLALYASTKVKSTFSKYAQQRASSGVTGAEVARGILRDSGLTNVAVKRTSGTLSDHYDPRAGELCLSEEVHDSPSLAALGVAAHEAGHALQDASGYVPLKLRQGIWPVAAFGSNLGPILAMIGIIILALAGKDATWAMAMAKVGIITFAVATGFTVMTIPVELNASRRALTVLESSGYIGPRERPHVKKVLDAAALTYMAAAFMAIMMLLRFILLLAMVARRD
ncbi:MAG: zinc metallopeptidase [Candidatus Brocadiaceae bacterium]